MSNEKVEIFNDLALYLEELYDYNVSTLVTGTVTGVRFHGEDKNLKYIMGYLDMELYSATSINDNGIYTVKMFYSLDELTDYINEEYPPYEKPYDPSLEQELNDNEDYELWSNSIDNLDNTVTNHYETISNRMFR